MVQTKNNWLRSRQFSMIETFRIVLSQKNAIRAAIRKQTEANTIDVARRVIEEVERINTECRKAEIGCVACKKLFAQNLNESLAPFREKRAEFEQDPDYVWDVLKDGADRARVIAQDTLAQVKDAIGLP